MELESGHMSRIGLAPSVWCLFSKYESPDGAEGNVRRDFFRCSFAKIQDTAISFPQNYLWRVASGLPTRRCTLKSGHESQRFLGVLQIPLWWWSSSHMGTVLALSGKIIPFALRTYSAPLNPSSSEAPSSLPALAPHFPPNSKSAPLL